MTILRIEHPVPDFERWKRAFDADPIDRRGSGVRRHRILRCADEPDRVELELDDAEAAAAVLARLRELWRGVDVIRDPRARILEVVETEEY
jgi:hypothetical protein